MHASTLQLTHGLIDYAGLFPPAALDMQTAVDAYARYRQSAMKTMLARFICPVSRLGEFHTATGDTAEGWGLSVLATPDGGIPGLEQDMRTLAAFHQESGARGECVELRVLQEFAHAPQKEIATTVRAMADTVATAGPSELYLELGFGEGWPEVLRNAVDGIALAAAETPVRVGLKVRTGGVTASAFPSVEQVAGFIIDAKEAGLPFKATAGLHHPVRHFASSVNANMHGFLNVLVGAVLYYHDRISTETLRDVLRDEDAASFQFTEAGLSWRDVPLSTAELAQARSFATSYGSCSFVEPWQDLHALGLAEATPPAGSL